MLNVLLCVGHCIRKNRTSRITSQIIRQPTEQPVRLLQWLHQLCFPSGTQAVVLVNLGSMFWLAVAMYEYWRLGRFSCHTGAKGLLSSQRGPCGGLGQVSVNVYMHDCMHCTCEYKCQTVYVYVTRVPFSAIHYNVCVCLFACRSAACLGIHLSCLCLGYIFFVWMLVCMYMCSDAVCPCIHLSWNLHAWVTFCLYVCLFVCRGESAAGRGLIE